MAGMPKRRARREAEARQALAAKSDTRVSLPDGKYSDEIAEEITDLIASGVSIDDTLVGETVAVRGVASRVIGPFQCVNSVTKKLTAGL
jgi:hypothetical protein